MKIAFLTSEQKKARTGNTFLSVTFTRDGGDSEERLAVFDPNLMSTVSNLVGKGEVEATLEKEGQYWNLVRIDSKAPVGPPITKADVKQTTYKADPAKQASIQLSAAMNNATTLVQAAVVHYEASESAKSFDQSVEVVWAVWETFFKDMYEKYDVEVIVEKVKDAFDAKEIGENE